MQPFSITCTTCQARLTVRSEAAIGQILSCPRCQSMVLVERPGSGKTTPQPAMPDAAISDDAISDDAAMPAMPDTVGDGFEESALPASGSDSEIGHGAGESRAADSGWSETVGDLPLDQQDWQAEEVPASTVKARWKEESAREPAAPEEGAAYEQAADGEFRDGEFRGGELRGGELREAGVRQDALPGDPFPEGGDPESGDPESGLPEDEKPVLPDAAWSSPGTRRLSRWLLLGVSGLTGVVLAVLVVGFLLSRGPAPDNTLAGRPDSDASAGPRDAEATKQGDDSVVDAPADDNGSRAATAGSGDRPPGKPRPATEAGADNASTHDGPPTDPSVAEREPGPPVPETPGSPPPTKNAGDSPQPEPVSGEPTTGETGEEPVPPRPAPSPGGTAEDPPGLTARPEPDDSEDIDEGAEVVDSLLEQFAPLMREPQFGDDTAGEDVATGTASDAQPAAEPPAVQRPERPAPLNLDVQARLAEPIVAINLEETPLENLVRFATRFSTIPIALDTDALQRRGISYRAPISLSQTNTTLGEVLREALEPLGLAITVGDSHLRITATDTAVSRWTHPVDDLLGAGGTDSETLQGWIQELVAPGSWRLGGGRGELRVEGATLLVNHSPAVQFGVLEFCEKLRAARGLSSRSEQESPRFGLSTHTERASEKLAETFLVNFIQPTPLTRILERIGSDSGTRILIDWQALLQAGWTPETELPFSSDNRPLRVALHSLLRPLDLTYRVVDAETLEVTTREALRQRAELEFYRVDDLLADDTDAVKLMEQIRSTLGADIFSPQGPGALKFDPVSGCLLVRLSQPRQLELHALLMQLRA